MKNSTRTSMKEALWKFRQNPPGSHRDGPLLLTSSISAPAATEEVAAAWATAPDDAMSLWAECREARLFEDTQYGQWGLVLLDPQTSARRTAQERALRPAELRDDDLIIGAFLGDQELLVMAPSESGARTIMVALPLDGRADWFAAGSDLAEFLERYFDAGGNKFWE